MTAAQKKALETIRKAGGTVVRFNFAWDNSIKLNLRAVRSLCEMGLLVDRSLPPRSGRSVVEYRLVATP